jgi:hypothetical protein
MFRAKPALGISQTCGTREVPLTLALPAWISTVKDEKSTSLGNLNARLKTTVQKSRYPS